MKRITLTIIFSIFVLSNLFSQVTQEWVRKYNGPGANRIEIATSIATDANGNVYVTGQSQLYKNNYDYVTIKYNSSGVQQWLARYNGPGDTTDYGAAIAVDAQGNVYVTGFSAGTGTGYDFATVKYSPAGVELWASRYNGPGNYNDAGRSIAVDDSGNVYVTGESWGGSLNYDYATVKYNANGVQQWAVRYNGAGNYVDQPSSLTIDVSGNVYVTGYSISGLSNYATVKYNSAGVQQWVAIYNGTGNGSDEAKSVKVDNSGNVYVTGRSFQSGTTYDYTTIKYNSSGDSLWVARYNGPSNGSDEASSIEIDQSGSVYVTGNSTGTLQDVATVKYNSNGVQQWASRYDGSTFEYGLSIKVDTSLNVYVAGFSGASHSEDYLTLKYNSNGVQQWANIYNGPGNDRDEGRGVAIDNQGNAYVTGFSYKGILSGLSDYATIKYNSSGAQQWVQRFNGPVRSTDLLSAIASDTAGNIYVTGQSEGDGSGMDVVTIKFNSLGDSLWVQRFNGPTNSNDVSTAICTDNSGNAYVTGNSWASGEFQSAQILTIKYNSSGVMQWYNIYPGGGFANSGTSVATDNSGNVYVTGNYRFSSQPFAVDYVTIKYNSNGDTVWTRRYNGGGLDEAKKIAVDPSGSIYVTGRSNSTNGLDFLTVKYNPTGDSVWTARFNGSGNNWDEPNDMLIDNSGNLYITGFSRSSSTYGSEDYSTVKYNSSGVLQWARFFNGTGNSYDASTSVAADTSNDVYVTGFSYGLIGGYSYLTIKYNSNGDSAWVQAYNSPGNNTDKATRIVTDGASGVYVTGGQKTGIGYDFGTIAYNTNGVQQWTSQYSSNTDSNYANPLLEADASGNVYLAGTTFENGTDNDIVLVKLSQGIGVKPLSNNVPKEFRLYQNYPNPFNPITKIRFDLPHSPLYERGDKGGFMTLKIYNVLGQEIAIILKEVLKPAAYEIQWNASNYTSGIYFYKLQTEGFTDTKKMILLK